MARRVMIDVRTTGPFFQYGTRPIEDANREWVEDMVREGEAKVGAQLYPGHGVLTGEYKRHIQGIIRNSQFGVISAGMDRRQAIIGSWLEGGRSRSERHRFRGYHIWRATRTHLRRLANELGGRVYARATRRLT